MIGRLACGTMRRMSEVLEFAYTRSLCVSAFVSMAGGLALLLSEFAGGDVLAVLGAGVMLIGVLFVAGIIFTDSRTQGRSLWRSTRTAFSVSFRWFFSLL